MKKSLLFLALCIGATSCTHFEEPTVDQSTNQKPALTRMATDPNPYSLANVQTAYNLIAEEEGLDPITFEPTHLYVDFTPVAVDSTSVTILKDSLGVELFDYPLDCDLTDAEIAAYESDTTNHTMYAAVPVNFTFPTEVTHAVLDSVYMQAQVTRGGDNNGVLSDDLWQRVLAKSMEITGNEAEPTPQTRASVWYPSAHITYDDDLTNEEIPLQGVKVRVQHFVNVGSRMTDANGETGDITGWGGDFRYAVKYHIVWETPYWNIRDNKTGQAKVSGNKQKSKWNIKLSDDTRSSMEAAVHRALYAYYYGNYPFATGMTKATGVKMNVALMYNYDGGGKIADFSPGRWGGGKNPIYLYGYNVNDHISHYQATEAIFHELGHATHYQSIINHMGPRNSGYYTEANALIKESWANGVEYIYMSALYPNQCDTLNYYIDSAYTTIVRSLYHQKVSLAQIENTIIGKTTIDGWKNAIIALKDNKNNALVDATIIDLFFSHSTEKWDADFKNLISCQNVQYTTLGDIFFKIEGLPLANITNWSTSDNSCTIKSPNLTSTTFVVRFHTNGIKTITAHLLLPNDIGYSASININIQPSPTISGTTNAFVGIGYTYSLLNYSELCDLWSFGAMTDYRILNSSTNQVTVMFSNCGSFYISATKYSPESNSQSVIAKTNISISGNGIIKQFYGYLNRYTPNDIWLSNDSNSSFSGRSLITSGDMRCFCAFTQVPTDHPYKANIIPIYQHYDTTNGYKYDNISANNNGVKCYMYNTYVTGTVPIYKIEYSCYVDKVLSYTMSYLTRENVAYSKTVSSWYWNWLGTKKTGERDWKIQQNKGIIGYAFPVE